MRIGPKIEEESSELDIKSSEKICTDCFTIITPKGTCLCVTPEWTI